MLRIRSFRRNTGFTLVEILVVLLIVAVLMAIALPIYLTAAADSQRKTCRSNLQTIANANQGYRLKTNTHTYTTNMAALISGGDLQYTPLCPLLGSAAYSIAGDTVNGITISCPSHGTFAPGQDHE